MQVKLSPEGEAILREAIANIEMNLEGWNQQSWVALKFDEGAEVCGTTACLAGHILSVGRQENLMELFNSQFGPELRGKFPETAMRLLGVDPDSPEGAHFDSRVFHYTHHKEDGFSDETMSVFNRSPVLAGTPENLKYLKERIAEVTGIEL